VQLRVMPVKMIEMGFLLQDLSFSDSSQF